MHPLLSYTEHRTAPIPAGPWIMMQKWHDLLFAHWALPAEQVRPLVARQLELDLWEGQAYVAVTPFRMSGVRPRGAPAPPLLHQFPELNVRTYVNYQGVPGVYFFSLDAQSRVGVWGARTCYHLPYYFASMSVRSEGEKIYYSSSRREGPRAADFQARYWPTSPPRQREKGALEHFLTERYCLYTTHQGKVLRASIHHVPWPLQDADAEIDINTVAQADGIHLPATKPLLHFSRDLVVLVWWPEVA